MAKVVPPGSIVRVRRGLRRGWPALYGYVIKKNRTKWEVHLFDPPDKEGMAWSLPENWVAVVPEKQVPDDVWAALAAWRMGLECS